MNSAVPGFAHPVPDPGDAGSVIREAQKFSKKFTAADLEPKTEAK
jgi:hypothetical protein